jgi:protein SCO1/2
MKSRLIFTTVCCAIFGMALVLGCGGDTTKQEREYPIHGRVVEVSKDQVKLDHEAIPGYMGAMVMSFPIAKPELLEGLTAGDRVQGKLSVGDGPPVITQLQKH